MTASASDRKLAANRRNAELSSGPRSALGKARASRNSVQHGLAAISVQSSGSRPEIKNMAVAICGTGVTAAQYGQALIIAESHHTIVMARALRANAMNKLVRILAAGSSVAHAKPIESGETGSEAQRARAFTHTALSH
jgi:hypothetical protein